MSCSVFIYPVIWPCVFAVFPGAVTAFDAKLKSPSSAELKWKEPTTGGPVHGYRISYITDETTTILVDKDVSLF